MIAVCASYVYSRHGAWMYDCVSLYISRLFLAKSLLISVICCVMANV